MKTLKDFTSEIQSKILKYQKRSLDGVFDGGRYNDFNFESAEEAVDWNYNKCKYKYPILIVAENPYEAQIYFETLKQNKKFHPILHLLFLLKNSINKKETISNFIKKIDIALYSQLYSQLNSQLNSQLHSQLRSQLDSQIRS